MAERSRCGRGRTTAARAVVIAGAVLAGVGGISPGAALATPQTLPVPEAAGITHPELDVAGAQIRRHEGTGGAVTTPAAASSARTATPLAGPEVTLSGAEPGMDVSSHQGTVDWDAAASNGASFAYVKATEGTGYTNPYFDQQFNGSRSAGLIHGAYHFALPDKSSGAAQANYFVDHGGAWRSDGETLPPALDIEYNPYGAVCYGLSARDMVNWIRDFARTVAARTGRDPVFYTSTNWWSQCTGNDAGFAATDPLWVPRYGSSVGALPAGWDYQTFWQYADSGVFPGDQDQFNGTYDRLQTFAGG